MQIINKKQLLEFPAEQAFLFCLEHVFYELHSHLKANQIAEESFQNYALDHFLEEVCCDQLSNGTSCPCTRTLWFIGIYIRGLLNISLWKKHQKWSTIVNSFLQRPARLIALFVRYISICCNDKNNQKDCSNAFHVVLRRKNFIFLIEYF